MCPADENGQRVKMQRWPSSGLKCTTKFGKDSMYAHHLMELQFPETLDMRIGAAKRTFDPNQLKSVNGYGFDVKGNFSTGHAHDAISKTVKAEKSKAKNVHSKVNDDKV